MSNFYLTAKTTDEQIEKATKEQLISECFKGFFAVLRKSKMRSYTKADAVREAKAERARIIERLAARASN